MKTTIKVTASKSLTVAPTHTGGVTIHAKTGNGDFILPFVLTADQCGALLFGIEQALEENEVAALRVAA